jgi:F-type H+-transporting ATPase subunit a
MVSKCIKSLLVAVFSLSMVFFSSPVSAQGDHPTEAPPKKKLFDANEVIFGHIMDAHEFHFLSWKGSDGEMHHATIPLPVILYSPQKGFSCFMSSRFHEGEHNYNGYGIITDKKIEEMGLDKKKYSAGQIVAVNDKGDRYFR